MGTAVIIDGCIEATQEAKYEPMNHSTKSNADHIRSWYAATAHTLPNCPTLEESPEPRLIMGHNFMKEPRPPQSTRRALAIGLLVSRGK